MGQAGTVYIYNIQQIVVVALQKMWFPDMRT